ncbi:MAG: PTS lactose/cellobiose transporter subunit IIA [Tepidanaerobacteraceae bacterium]|jgi:PTS system cellobiose-specific IIA component|nr:PTS lactose/cellobiose transporter subunit IIA [Tepidanaerobacteraceae bacterium]
MDVIEKCMVIIANSGEGKSLAMRAIKQARAGKFDEAEIDLKHAEEAITKAHQAHSELLFYDAEHQDLRINMLLVHAANHLTSAGVIKELVEEIIYLYKTR